MTNVFNNKSFTVVGDNWLNAGQVVSTPGFGALIVGLPEKRTASLQTKFKF